MSKKKMNCWEYKQCRRETQDLISLHVGKCPAVLENNLNGIHGGRNAGRSCWTVPGTLCNNRVQGSFASKNKTCYLCEFYQLVKREEGEDFIHAKEILSLMGEHQTA